MFDSFNMPARRAVMWAHREAVRSGSETIGPEHLLLGFLIEDQRESGITPQPGDPLEPFFSSEIASNLRLVLAQQALPDAPKTDTTDLPLAEAAQWALMAATEHAGSKAVRLLHILWGLIGDEQSSVSNLLTTNGVTVEQVEDAINRRLGS
jgi:ATP-dependent Clp protease ATP-binding subunit ClpA